MLLPRVAASSSKLDHRSTSFAGSRLQIAALYARLGETDAAFEWLEKACAAHDDEMVRLKEELGFDNLRSDPNADLLRRVGLPQ